MHSVLTDIYELIVYRSYFKYQLFLINIIVNQTLLLLLFMHHFKESGK